MSTERQDGTGLRRKIKKRPLALAVRSYLLAAIVHALLLVLSEIPAGHVVFLRLGWWLGPWPSFPFPYDDFTVYDPQPFLPLSHEIPRYVAIFVTMALSLILVVGVLHSLSFWVAIGIHSMLGWPKYWRDVRQTLDLQSVWALSARRTWWLWPLGQAVWLLLEQIAWGCPYAFYPIVDDGTPYLVLHNLAICFAFAVVTSRLLSPLIIGAVDRNHVRCNECGYLLRGIESKRCPECGRERNGVKYGIGRQRGAKWQRLRRLLPWLTVFVLFLAPVWMPFGLVSLPRTWLRFVPEVIRPAPQVLRQDLDDFFPIRWDAVCIMEHEGAIAIVWFEKSRRYRADYRVAYWSDVQDMDLKKPPDLRSSGQVKNGGGPELPIGPWQFSYQASSEDMFWLTRPDPSYSVEAFESDRLPARFQGLSGQ